MRIIVFTFCFLMFVSCVSTKVYEQLKAKFDMTVVERDSIIDSLRTSQGSKNRLKNRLDVLKRDYDVISADKNQLEQNNKALNKQIQNIKFSYELLEKNRNSDIVMNSRKSRDLMDSLDIKQRHLNDKIKVLSHSQQRSRRLSKRIDSLKSVAENYLNEIDTLETNQASLFEIIDSLELALNKCEIKTREREIQEETPEK